jgi:hypothetical protein
LPCSSRCTTKDRGTAAYFPGISTWRVSTAGLVLGRTSTGTYSDESVDCQVVATLQQGITKRSMTGSTCPPTKHRHGQTGSTLS